MNFMQIMLDVRMKFLHTVFNERGKSPPANAPGSLKTDAKKAPPGSERIATYAARASWSNHGESVWTDAVKMVIVQVEKNA